MQLGLHVPIFAWEGGSDALGQHLANVARAADEAGFAQITVMDHFFALGPDDAYRNPMLEAYTALGFIAACTSRIRVGSQVTGVTYRHPGVLIKQATTLNVLSQGARLPGHRRRVVREGAPRVRRGVSAAQGALRATRRDAPDRPPGVERRRQSVSGQVLPAGRAAAVADGGEQAAAEDPHRRQRRAQDPEAGGAVRRRVPHQRPVAGWLSAQARGARRALCEARPRPEGDRTHRWAADERRAGRLERRRRGSGSFGNR